jgi:3-deoxy-D-manno-octulosonic-acid transferase
VIRFIYNLLWPIGLLFFLPGYLRKMFRRGGYREKFGQRLGMYDVDLRRRLAKQNPIWLHAVSVGEAAIALKLAEKLRTLKPDQRIVLTTTTTTGFAFANKNAPAWMEVMYSPLDFWPIMHRAFAAIRPERIALVEAEVWPNLVAEARRRRIQIALVNARLSPRSERRFRRFRFFVRQMFRDLDLVCVQDPQDVERWAALGVERGRIQVAGSIKYDAQDVHVDLTVVPELLRQVNVDNSRPILFGGSTHSGEEEILAQIFLKLRAQFPALCLFIAPRHVERTRQIRKQLEAFSLAVRFSAEDATVKATPDCVLLDKTGELQRWYGIATVAFIGKSLTSRGGQNPVEPIVAGVPVIFGPHMENFAALAKSLVGHDAAIQVNNADELEGAAEKLLRDGELRRALVQNAEEVLAQHRGATARTAQLIVDLAKR